MTAELSLIHFFKYGHWIILNSFLLSSFLGVLHLAALQYFINTFLRLDDHPVLLPGYTTNFRVFTKSYQQHFFPFISLIKKKILTNTHMVLIAMPPFQKNPCSIIPHWQQLLGNCQHEMVFILYEVLWLLHAHNSQWSQWKMRSSTWSSGQCQRNILTILLDIKNTLPNSVTWL